MPPYLPSYRLSGDSAYGADLPSYSFAPSYADGLPGGGASGLIDAGVSGAAGGLTSGLLGGAMAFNPIGAAILGGGTLLSSLMGSIMKKKQEQRQQQATQNLQTNQLASSNAQSTQDLASRESTLDPFRQQMAQGGDIEKLDRLERGTYTKPMLSFGNGGAPSSGGNPYAGYVPQVSGGYSYAKSPELVQSANALKTSIMAGNQAPSMTNPANYGKSSALDLLGVLGGSKNAASPNSFATGAPNAPSSLGADPAANMIRQGFLDQTGRNPSDAEIQSVLGTLNQIAKHPVTAADSDLVQRWISQNLATSTESTAYRKTRGLAPAPGASSTATTGRQPGVWGRSYRGQA